MKKLQIVFTAFLLTASNLFAYDYSGEAFSMDFEEINSADSEDHAEINSNALKTVRNGETKVRKLEKKTPVHLTENSSRSEKSLSRVITHDKVTDYFIKLAIEEVRADIREDGIFSAGAKWPAAWTRDMAYSADLSLFFLFPEAVEQTLKSRVENDMILQDTGSGGSWPVSTDRVVWGIAAFNYALYKQDTEYFNHVYKVLSNTVKYDLNVNFDEKKQLFKGESTFLDWREQTYPRWAGNEIISNSFALGTNAVYYKIFQNLKNLAEITGQPESEIQFWDDSGKKLKDGIINNFWIDDKKYFASYIINDVDCDRYEGYDTLGESLSIIFDIAEKNYFKNIINAVLPGKWGCPVVAPQLVNVPPYHNDAVWPFVQGYRGIAAKKSGDICSCEKEFASMIYAASMFQTFKENYVSSVFSEETQTNSDRQLWSCAGFLSYIYRVICGIDFTPSGLNINPLVFDSFKDGVFLQDFKFGNNNLNLEISGTGDRIASFFVNGEEVSQNFVIPYASEVSDYTVSIVMEKSEDFEASYDPEYMAENYPPVFDSQEVSPVIPVVRVEYEKKSAEVSWKGKNPSGWKVFSSYDKSFTTDEKSCFFKSGPLMKTIKICAVPENPSVPVYFSKSVRVESPKNTWFIEAEDSDFSGGKISEDEEKQDGNGAVNSEDFEKVFANKGKYLEQWGGGPGDFINFNFNAKKAGDYIIDFRFKNGHGPVNTGEKCAMAGIFTESSYISKVVFPQQGSWTSWNFSAPVIIHLGKGKNVISLKIDETCGTQHGSFNPVSVDLMRISRIK